MAFFTALMTVLGQYTATIIAGGIIAAGAGFALTNKGRLIIKSGWNWFTSTAANNPRIAAGAYDEKIDDLRKQLAKAQQAHELALGQVYKEQERLANAQRTFKRLSAEAVKLEKNGKHEEATRLALEAKKQQDIIIDCDERLPSFQAMSEHAGKTVKEVKGLIEDYQSRKDKTISDMEKAQIEQQVANMLNDVNVKPIDATIEGIERHTDSKKYQAIGARASYEMSDKRQLQKASELAYTVNAEDYLQQLLLSENNEDN